MSDNYGFMDAMTEEFANINRIGEDAEHNNPVTLRFPYTFGDTDGWAMMKEEWVEDEKRYNYSLWKRTDTRGKVVFAVAIHPETNTVGVWRIKFRLAEQLMAYSDGIVNRDFILSRSGSGIDTKYMAEAMDSKPLTDAQKKAVAKNRTILHDEIQKLLAKSQDLSAYDQFMGS